MLSAAVFAAFAVLIVSAVSALAEPFIMPVLLAFAAVLVLLLALVTLSLATAVESCQFYHQKSFAVLSVEFSFF